VTQLVEALRHTRKSGVCFPLGSSRPQCGPGVDSACKRNEYQGYILGGGGRGKGSRCVGLTTLPPSCSDCLEIMGTSAFWSPKVLSRRFVYLYSIRRFIFLREARNFLFEVRTGSSNIISINSTLSRGRKIETYFSAATLLGSS